MFKEWLQRDGGFPVRITGYNATTKAHSWKLQIIEVDGTFAADTRNITAGNLFEMNEQRVPDGTYLWARWAGLDSGGMSIFMCVKPAVGFHVATLTKTAGSDGSASAACSYIYTVSDLATGAVLATGVAPEHQRPLGRTAPATRGLAWMDGATCRLVLTDEAPTKKECA